jgi:hypothetical protein
VSKEKGLDDFCRLDMPWCEKIIVGDGPYRAELERRYPTVKFVGAQRGLELASYYAQAQGHQVVYCAPSVTQDRNVHDLTIDFNKEIIGYQNNLGLIQALQQDPQSIRSYLPGRSIYAWDLFRKYIQQREEQQ